VLFRSVRPERVRGLMMISPAAAPLDDAAVAALRQAFTLATPADALRFLDRICLRRPPGARLVASKLVEQAARAAVRDLLHAATSADAPTPAELGQLAVPTWLLWGRAERLLPPSMLTYLRAHLPAHVTVAPPEHSGHSPHLDRPARVPRLTLAFPEPRPPPRVRLAPAALTQLAG